MQIIAIKNLASGIRKYLIFSKTGIIVFGPEKSASNSRKRIQDYIQSMEDNGVSHRIMTAKEVNDEYKDQLKLPDEYLCVSEEDGGILRASKAVATLQVQMERGREGSICL